MIRIKRISVGLMVFVVLITTLNRYRNMSSCENSNTVNNIYDTDIETLVTKSTNLKQIIWFYADWCGHCKDFEREWMQFTKEIQGLVSYEKINGDEDRMKTEPLQSKYKIRGYPTVVFVFKDSTYEHYTGPRTSVSLMMKTKQMI